MPKFVTLDRQIDHAKEQLELAVKDRYYNFIHPDVIALSQKLDRLINQLMKEKKPVRRVDL